MAHNANFVDNRLRLASFLRVVEKGMPQRPSRFKRRVQVTDEQPQADPVSIVQVNAALSTASLQTGADQTKPSVHAESIYDNPRSSTPEEVRLSPTVDDSHHVHGGELTVQQRSDSLPVKQSPKKAGTARVCKAKELTSTPPRSSGTRKRRLPVNGLALLRTTTSDGLPQPGDANIIFASPISFIDPIEDSQVPKSTNDATSPAKRLKDKATSKQRLSPRMLPKLQTSNIHPAKATKSPKAQRRLAALGNGKRQPQLCFEVASDGFIGPELEWTSKKPNRRGKTNPTERKKVTVVPGLPLASGLLPVPPFEHVEPSVALEHLNSQNSDHLPTPCGLEHFQDVAKLGQLPLTRGRSIQSEFPSQNRSQWEKAIRHQLSSITAPLRRDSESSESETATEDRSTYYEDDNHMVYSDAINGSCFAPLTRVSTFVDDSSYFENAMHHLDMADSVEEELWSQNNEMD